MWRSLGSGDHDSSKHKCMIYSENDVGTVVSVTVWRRDKSSHAYNTDCFVPNVYSMYSKNISPEHDMARFLILCV